MIKLRHLAAASAVVLSLAVAVPPASAQWIVYDPSCSRSTTRFRC
jgi:hypothetical protein